MSIGIHQQGTGGPAVPEPGRTNERTGGQGPLTRSSPAVGRVGTARQGSIRTSTVRSNSTRAMFRLARDSGAATAEYVIATMAAVGFAGLLILILRGDEVRGILTELVRNALTVG
jgi:hypothetical protein